jgi:predicted anti-sigma-YlaC factor YlaD
MNHISEDILIEFADGSLDTEKQKEAELHLQQCPACREELDMYRSLSVIMEKENLVMAPAAMVNQVMHQVELHQHIMLRKAKSRRTAIRFAGIMLGFLAAMFGLGLWLDHGTGSIMQIPTYITDALNYAKGFEFSIKNPLILYVAVSVIILLVSERIIRSLKPRKLSV